jgi:hypothetical protein
MKVGSLLLILALQNCVSSEIKTAPSGGNNTSVTASGREPAGTPSKGDNTMEYPDEKNMPKLDVKIDTAGNSLTLEYKVKNITSQTIFLFNVLYNWDNSGTPIIDDHQVYSCLLHDGTLHLAKQILPLPKLKKVEIRRIPYTTKLLPGEEFSEKVTLKVPIEEYDPYFPRKPDSVTEDRAAEFVYFTLQFIRETEDLKELETNIPKAFAVSHPNIFGAVETLDSRRIATLVKVEKRKDDFEEF